MHVSARNTPQVRRAPPDPSRYFKGFGAATLALASTLACGPGHDPAEVPPQVIPPRAVASGPYGPRTPVARLVQDADEVRAVWPTTPADLDVDFERESLVLVALGERPTGGYAVEIREVLAGGGALHVRYVEVRPGARCFVTQAVTYPYAAVAIPRFDGPATFDGVVETVDCP